jgi:hypothetical protein
VRSRMTWHRLRGRLSVSYGATVSPSVGAGPQDSRLTISTNDLRSPKNVALVTADRRGEVLRMTELGPEPLDLDGVDAFLQQHVSVLRSIGDAESRHVNRCLRVQPSRQHGNGQL